MIELNKIYNMDCLKGLKQLKDNSVDLVLTDPPYGMSYQSSWRTDKYDKIKDDDNIDWFKPLLEELYRVLKNNSHCYIFCNDYAISYFRDWAKEIGFNIKRTLVWVKNNHTSGDLKGDYGNKTEFIIYLQKGRRELNGKRDTNVLFFNREESKGHPTIKPLKLIEYLLIKSSNEKDIVLDPFMGSGTTAVACKELNRQYIGFELQEEYCNVSNKRLDKVNNKKVSEWFKQ